MWCVAFIRLSCSLLKNHKTTTNQITNTHTIVAMSAQEEEIDIFAEETEEEKELNAKNAAKKQEQKAASAATNQKLTKSQVVLDIKPWESETDLDALAEILRNKTREGLVWGAMEKRPLAFGVNKLVAVMTIDDHLVSAEDIEEMITEEEDYVQSYEIATWNKL